MTYCKDLFNYNRRQTNPVHIGNLILGGDAPVLVQSMTNTSTMDTDGSVDQCIKIIDAGADLVRLTAQGVREAANLANIRKSLSEKGFSTPLVADIHFNPKAADEAALHVEKVRINPGNYVDAVKTFSHYEYTEEEYKLELQKIRDRFVPFLSICKANKRAIRIGVNHGSLSDRIMSRYGDTPAGMVESCMEFLRICIDENFFDVVISIKASNTLVMVQTVRLLVARMNDEGMRFPLHLGVTEAGDGEDGRIKSAVGTGSLLVDGIGDTIRVSLSEDPELEIPVARMLLEEVELRTNHGEIKATKSADFDPFSYKRRETAAVGKIGGNQPPVVIYKVAEGNHSGSKADFLWVNDTITDTASGESFNVYAPENQDITSLKDTAFLRLTLSDFNEALFETVKDKSNLVLILESVDKNNTGEFRAMYHKLLDYDCKLPVILTSTHDYNSVDRMQIGLSLDFGPFLLDGFGDGICAGATQLDEPAVVSCLFGILQASRLRMTKTEYISCPGCGRTLFNLQNTIARIKEKTSHLKGLKIGIMGCIVNGPGEMADADYGYVGAGRKQVSLYKKQLCVEKNIPEDQAVDKLIQLIKEGCDWVEPEDI